MKYIQPKPVPHKCELSKLTGFNCKFPAKYHVEVTGEVEGEDGISNQTKIADVCGKHCNSLKEGAEGDNYTIKVFMIQPPRK